MTSLMDSAREERADCSLEVFLESAFPKSSI